MLKEKFHITTQLLARKGAQTFLFLYVLWK